MPRSSDELRLESLAQTIAFIGASDMTDRSALALLALLDLLPDGITLVGGGPDFPIIANTSPVASILGRPRPEIQGLLAGSEICEFGLSMPDGNTARPERSPIWRATHLGERVADEHWIIERPDGSRRAVSISAVPVVGASGRVAGAVQSWRDITLEKQNESLARVLEDLVAPNRDTHVLGGLIASCVRHGTAAIGADSAAMLIQQDDAWRVAYVHELPNEVVGTRVACNAAATAIHRRQPVVVDQSEGSEDEFLRQWLVRSALAVPLMVGDTSVGVLMLTSRTGRGFDSLDVDFARHLGAILSLAAQNASANSELREAAEKRTQFLALLSHELRNPLMPMRNSLFVLDCTGPGGLQAIRAKSVLDRQVDLLARLLDDLLNVTRLTSGRLHVKRERIDLVEVVVRTAEDESSLLVQAGLLFDVQVDAPFLPVVGDAARLSQAVSNLLRNSIKFTPAGGRVTLRLCRVGSDAAISVRDTGKGLDPTTIPRLFEPFVLGDASIARTTSGLGVGLSLVKGIVELHEGTVEGHSEGIGTGAEFTIRIPVDEKCARDQTEFAEQ